jgi:hypothetical protein
MVTKVGVVAAYECPAYRKVYLCRVLPCIAKLYTMRQNLGHAATQ